MTCAIARRIGEYIATAPARALPDDVVEKTKHHLLDSLAAMVSGARLAPGLAAARVAEALGGRPEATVVGTSLVTSAVHAALANGMAAHADETDDSHLGGLFHPGCGIVPAALAVAEREARDGTALVRAIALGYDIGARSTKALGYENPRSALHSTHSIGTGLGAAAAAGALLRLTEPQAIHLLSYAVQQASGIPYWPKDSEHIEKSFDFGGMGARNGVTAALMVASGCTGVTDCLTGSPSYLSAFALEPKPEELDAELGSRYEIQAASIKKWCVGSPIQAALDSLEALIEQHDLRAEEVESLTATLPDDRLPIVDNREMPDICLQHLLAVLLID
ncbi:MAG TPA: MmgE/PrpD family protein, partial [Kiloniellales bacterium]|nr:MmgE/PrpD family protein [Kiloniellales bacterium]